MLTGRDIAIRDFGGDPARSYSERRLKRSPLRDVAGLIRSFYDVAYEGFLTSNQLAPDTAESMLHLADTWAYYMTESGFSFLQSAESLSGIDTLLNESPGQPSRYVYNQTHRCYKAIIAARLTNNPHFDGLIDRYRHQLNVQTRNPYEQLNFERLVAFLLHYSMN